MAEPTAFTLFTSAYSSTNLFLANMIGKITIGLIIITTIALIVLFYWYFSKKH